MLPKHSVLLVVLGTALVVSKLVRLAGPAHYKVASFATAWQLDQFAHLKYMTQVEKRQVAVQYGNVVLAEKDRCAV